MEDIAKTYVKNNESKLGTFLTQINTWHVIVFGIILLVLVSFSNNENGDPKYNYVIYFILVGVISILYFKPNKERKLLPDSIVKKIAQEALDAKVREGKEFNFDSKVNVMSACHLKYENDMITGTSGPVAWEVGFIENVHGTKYEKEGVIRIHPYEGFVTGIAFYPLGYTGKESRDRDIIPVGVVQGSVKTTEFGGNPKQ